MAMSEPPIHGRDEAPVLRAENLVREFGSGPGAVVACAGISLELYRGELLVLRGRSGAGKTTLLNLLAALDRPTSGSVWLSSASPDGAADADIELSAASEAQLVDIRRTQLGFIFQGFGLIPVLSAAENIEIPLRLLGMPAGARDERVAELLELVGLAGHAAQRPSELSGGQQQRVGIARALAAHPRVLFADEPTGQLDSGTAAAMMDLLVDLVHNQGVSAVLTTHDASLMLRADRVLEIHDGTLVRTPGRHALVEVDA